MSKPTPLKVWRRALRSADIGCLDYEWRSAWATPEKPQSGG